MRNANGVTCIIPARVNSTRFPSKLLKPLGKSTVLEHTYRSAVQYNKFRNVIIASGDSTISDFCQTKKLNFIDCFGEFDSGSQRVFYAAKKMRIEGPVLNLQGDQPFIGPSDMKLLIANYNPIGISTLIKSATSPISVDNDHPVYVTLNKAKKIITFSRREIPAGHTNNLYYHHIGVYLFSEKILSNKSIFHNCPWAKSELLEQLEFICNGIDFIGVDTESEHYEINTENDLNRAHNFLLTKDKNEL